MAGANKFAYLYLWATPPEGCPDGPAPAWLEPALTAVEDAFRTRGPEVAEKLGADRSSTEPVFET